MIKSNIDHKTVEGFGDEWKRFDQSCLRGDELQRIYDMYFKIFPWNLISKTSVGFDLGCGSGRWAKCVSPQVSRLHCIDASVAALEIAKRNLREYSNCEFHHCSVDRLPFENNSMDFGYSLGVLHHVPDTQGALASCARKLKPGAPLLVYLYYAFDNRPLWFRLLWKISDLIRRMISRMPFPARYLASQLIAGLVYWPLARLARLFDSFGYQVDSFPLSFYRQRSFYTMRTDALDRFGTRLEQRFTADEIKKMFETAGFTRVKISESPPYWCAVGFKAS